MNSTLRAARGAEALQHATAQHGDDYTACDLVTDVLHSLHRVEGYDTETVLLLLGTAKGHFLNELEKENKA